MRVAISCRIAVTLLLVGLISEVHAENLQAGGLTLTLDGGLQVTGLSIDGITLKVTPQSLVSICEVEKREYVPASVKGGNSANGLNLDFPGMRVTGNLNFSSKDDVLHFAIDLKGQDLPARGLLMRFSIPVDATGWQWHMDMQTTNTIMPDKLYENVVPLRAYADLPEWKDKPALRMGRINRNFCTVITGQAGLALAVPLDKPCHFRTAYDGVNKRLDIIFDFALSPDTRKPNEVSFAFDLYQCDPKWGLRSALAKYYQIYPDMFKVYVPEQGQWMAFNRLSEIDNANEFMFALQEGAPETEYDDKINVLSTIYYTHAGMMGNLPPPYNPEKDPLPPYEDQVSAVEKSFKNITKMDGLYEKVGTRKPDGKLAVEKWSVYAHLLAQFNLDPDLPWGDYLIKNTITKTDNLKKDRGANLDGFYYDGLSAGLDYGQEHFKTADAPLLWDPINKKPFLNNFFSSVKFARRTAELLRPRGQITMMNGALGDSFYVIPWLDILGAETGLIITRPNFNYIRTVIHHKPFLTLLKGNYEKNIARPEMELFMKRCLAYGVFPGFFDWPPSGLGPGGQYWNHPRYYERDRDIFRKYEPLCRTLALAGWEPVTHAYSSDPVVYVERFGPDSHGIVWLTVLNEEKRDHNSTTLTIDAKALGLDVKTVKAYDMVSGKALDLKKNGDTITLDLNVPADGVMAIQLAKPENAAAWHITQSIETLDRGMLMRKVDADKPPIAVHWRPGGTTYEREITGDKTNIVIRINDKNSSTLHQWAMLFQTNAQPLKLKVRVAADNLATSGCASIQCNLAWVTPSYTHYERKGFDLPGGTYDWREIEFDVKHEQALRSIDIKPTTNRKKTTGTLKIGRISLTDDGGHEYVIDPEFTQWYEPFPVQLREPVENGIQSIKTSLMDMEKLTPRLQRRSFRKKLGVIYHDLHELESRIMEARAGNGCRRVLRDLETVKQHMGRVAMMTYNISPPVINGPAAVTAGDTVLFTLTAPKVSGISTRTELQSNSLQVIPQKNGGSVVIPATASAGDEIIIRGNLLLGKTGEEIVVTTSHKITILKPLELTIKSEGFNPDRGVVRLRLIVRNNHVKPVPVNTQVNAPAGWEVTTPAPLNVPTSSDASTEVTISPTGKAVGGSVEIGVRAISGNDMVQTNEMLLYIPREANRIKNAGFEDGLTGWGSIKQPSRLDTAVTHSGKSSLLLENPVRTDSCAIQSVTLNQKTPCPILVQAFSKALDVEGQTGNGYSLYVDIYYMDGTPLYGQTFHFTTGTTDWQLGKLYLKPAKPIRNVNIYLLLRGKSGKAWFDNISLMEEPRP
ncbi:MAG: hypothetical protein PHR77_10600 [Kiritimatiellae bacterium]|nr:hypothetical protein [Kiritimatiellia bacterium]MDD5522394.1 hypothetical protein [Kiritimatiellia bacterium]